MLRRVIVSVFAFTAVSTAHATSIEAIGPEPTALSPSIIMLGAPAAPAAASSDAKAQNPPDPLQTAALPQAESPAPIVIDSPSIITLGEPAPEETVAAEPAGPKAADVAVAAPAAPAAKPRPDATPVVMRGDFGDLRGSTDAAAEPAAPTPTEPVAASEPPEATPASVSPSAAPAEDLPKPQGEQPAIGAPSGQAEMDR